MLSDKELQAVVKPLLREGLSAFGFEDADIMSSFDHEGEPIILAKVRYRSGAPKLDGRHFLDLVSRILDHLSARGDQRLLHVRHFYADGLAAADTFPSRPRRAKSARRQ